MPIRRVSLAGKEMSPNPPRSQLHDPANPHQRKAQVSKAIDDGKGNDRSVFTEKSICYDSPKSGSDKPRY